MFAKVPLSSIRFHAVSIPRVPLQHSAMSQAHFASTQVPAALTHWVLWSRSATPRVRVSAVQGLRRMFAKVPLSSIRFHAVSILQVRVSVAQALLQYSARLRVLASKFARIHPPLPQVLILWREYAKSPVMFHHPRFLLHQSRILDHSPQV